MKNEKNASLVVATNRISLGPVYAKMIDAAGFGVVDTDVDGTIVAINPAARELTGYTEEQAVGTPIDVLIPDTRYKKVFEDKNHRQYMHKYAENFIKAKKDEAQGKPISVIDHLRMVMMRTADSTEVPVAASVTASLVDEEIASAMQGLVSPGDVLFTATLVPKEDVESLLSQIDQLQKSKAELEQQIEDFI